MCWPLPVRRGGAARPGCHRGVHAGEQVGDRDADLLRAAAGQVVALAGHAHQPAHALDDVVVAGAVAVGAGLAEAGDRAVDQARVGCAQRCVVEPVARQVADLEVLDQHVAVAASARTSAWPSGCAMSSVTERLLRLAPRK